MHVLHQVPPLLSDVIRDWEESDHWIPVLSLPHMTGNTLPVMMGRKLFSVESGRKPSLSWERFIFHLSFLLASWQQRLYWNIGLDCWAVRQAQLCQTLPSSSQARTASDSKPGKSMNGVVRLESAVSRDASPPDFSLYVEGKLGCPPLGHQLRGQLQGLVERAQTWSEETWVLKFCLT